MARRTRISSAGAICFRLPLLSGLKRQARSVGSGEAPVAAATAVEAAGAGAPVPGRPRCRRTG